MSVTLSGYRHCNSSSVSPAHDNLCQMHDCHKCRLIKVCDNHCERHSVMSSFSVLSSTSSKTLKAESYKCVISLWHFQVTLDFQLSLSVHTESLKCSAVES